MAEVRIDGLSKRFGDVQAVEETHLDIRDGEFLSLLGPSGCGKTTLLRMLAGFTTPSAGSVFFGDRDITALPPEKREVGMVFQNYALFPHMTAEGNVAFGLEVRSVPAAERAARVVAALDRVGLKHLAGRPVSDLSGGEQQRVALARAIVIEPTILLLDEPLSNLDAALRVDTRSEIRRLQRELRITTVYVTHDQEEALALSDRIAVMRSGRIHQVGTPAEVYARPKNRFVGGFLGRGTFIEATLKERAGEGAVFESLHLPTPITAAACPEGLAAGALVDLLVRPEDVKLRVRSESSSNSTDAPAPWTVHGKILTGEYLGAYRRLEVRLSRSGLVFQALLSGQATTANIDGIREVEVTVEIAPTAVWAVPRDGSSEAGEPR